MAGTNGTVNQTALAAAIAQQLGPIQVALNQSLQNAIAGLGLNQTLLQVWHHFSSTIYYSALFRKKFVPFMDVTSCTADCSGAGGGSSAHIPYPFGQAHV